ncbi:MAG: type II toxin-antitoxin system RelE/ParE family toxin [Gammaproteobacteria bacterium]
MMRVIWSEESLQQLEDIRHYISKENPKAATALIRRLIERGERLSIAAARGRRVPEYPESELRELFERPYRLIYRIDQSKGEVQIQTIFHYRQIIEKRPGRSG